MKDTFTIRINEETENLIYLPPSYKDYSIHHITFGSITLPCSVKIQQVNRGELWLSKNLFTLLKIPHIGKTHIFVHGDTLHLGPLIAIFTAGFTNSLLRPVGERSLFFAKLLALEEMLGAYAFIFGAHQVNWENGTIHGLYHSENGWIRHEFPFPDVIYDRLPNRKIENHQPFKIIKQRLKDEYLIPWFNPSFFDKWEIHQLLSQNVQTKKYLPETYLKPTIETIKQMLMQHQNIFLKPINGSLGNGVYQLLFSKESNTYYIRYLDKTKNKNRLTKFGSFENLQKFIESKLNLEQYIIQQGIVLQRKHQQQFDFRIHTNKNRKGTWQVSAIASKVAGKGSVTTHIHNGGTVKTIDEIISNPIERKQIIDELTEIAIKMSETIDGSINGFIGEIGFDFGIDKNQNIWFFEANSRPGRSIFLHPQLKKDDLLSRELSMSYAIYLTEQTYQHPEVIFQ